MAGACAAAVLVLGVSGPAAWSAGLGASGGAAGAALPGHVVLPQAAPQLPAGSTTLGAAPAGQVLDLDVVLAGQDPAGLAQAVAAVSTPGSPDYRHYLSAAQYAAQFGPSAAEVAQVSSALRGEGLTVGAPEPGSTLLPVSGTASVVSAALGTPLEIVQAPGDGCPGHREHGLAADPVLARRRGDRRGRARRAGQGAGHDQAGPPRPGPDGLDGTGSPTRRSPPRPSSRHPPRERPARPPPPSPTSAPRRPAPAPRARPSTGPTPRPSCPPSSASTSSSGRAVPGSGSPSPSWSSSSTPPATSPPSRPVTGCPTPSATCRSTVAPAARPRAPRARPRSIPSWPPSTPPPPPSSSTRRPTVTTPRPSTSSTASPATTARRS